MIDALLFAVRDAIRNAKFGYGVKECEVMPSENPPPRCGNFFVAVHQGPPNSTAENSLDERYVFNVCLTARVSIPLDRVGDQLLAKQLVRQPGPGGSPSFNSRLEQIAHFLHMNWQVLQTANHYLVDFSPGAEVVYGFSEPARYKGSEVPALVGGWHFNANPEAKDVGLKSDMSFADCRRFQAIGSFV